MHDYDADPHGVTLPHLLGHLLGRRIQTIKNTTLSLYVVEEDEFEKGA
jgi:hypothetical protein